MKTFSCFFFVLCVAEQEKSSNTKSAEISGRALKGREARGVMCRIVCCSLLLSPCRVHKKTFPRFNFYYLSFCHAQAHICPLRFILCVSHFFPLLARYVWQKCNKNYFVIWSTYPHTINVLMMNHRNAHRMLRSHISLREESSAIPRSIKILLARDRLFLIEFFS